MFFGIIGLILITAAWLFQTIDIIKKKRADIDLKFIIPCIAGTIFLIFHALEIKDIIFTILQIVVLIAILISLFYAFKKHKVY